MQVAAVALTHFQHDDIRGFAGRTLDIDESTARDLERRGLVRINAPKSPVQPINEGKADAAGTVLPSSALPAAQASPPKTPSSSTSGSGRRRKTATRSQ